MPKNKVNSILAVSEEHFNPIRAEIEMLLSKATLEDFEKVKALQEEKAETSENGYKVIGGVAHFVIAGPILSSPDWWLDYLGIQYSNYETIVSELLKADNDPKVGSIEVLFDSPGGYVDGMFQAAEMIQGLRKQKTALVDSLCASAAYTLASQFDSIKATRTDSAIGSVGVLATYTYYKNWEEVNVTSSNAPKKAPDARTESGRNDIRELLDQYEALMLQTIAEGRGVTSEEVSASYGRGAVMLAENAFDMKMIDGIPNNSRAFMALGENGEIMNLEELKSKHPDVYKAAVEEGSKAGYESGLKAGQEKERARVAKHLTSGRESKDFELMMKGIEEGVEAHEMALQYAKAMHTKMTQSENPEGETEALTGSHTPSNDPSSEGLNDDVFHAAALELGIDPSRLNGDK